jgi:hypothetical protein
LSCFSGELKTTTVQAFVQETFPGNSVWHPFGIWFRPRAECPVTVVCRRDVHEVNRKLLSWLCWVCIWRAWMPRRFFKGGFVFWFSLTLHFRALHYMMLHILRYLISRYYTLL